MKTENTIWIVVLIIVLAFFLFVMPLGGGGWGGFCGMMGNYYGTNYGWGMMGGFGWLFMILIVIALMLFIVWLVRQLQNPEHQQRVVRRKR